MKTPEKWTTVAVRMVRTVVLVVVMYLVFVFVLWCLDHNRTSTQGQVAFVTGLAILLLYRVMKLEDDHDDRANAAAMAKEAGK